MSGSLITEIRGSSMILRLNNPTRRNALSPNMYSEGIAALARAASDSKIRTVILTGEGGFFCSGGNLLRLQANREQDPQNQADSIDRFHGLVRAIRNCPLPVIAAVEGAAAGAGFSLAMNCDLIVGATSARFTMAYVKVGLSPDGGGSWFVTQNLPRQIAAQMLLEGDSWTCERLWHFGLVNHVVADGESLAYALHWADRLAALSPHALGQIKRLIDQAQTSGLSEHLEREKSSFVKCLFHPDAGEAISAFFDRRPAQF